MKVAQLKRMAGQIKAARERKGLSQRALAERVGITQGHISRIENATIDLQASTLIQIARALDLELILIPRTALPAVESLSKEPTPTPTPAYTLDDDETNDV